MRLMTTKIAATALFALAAVVALNWLVIPMVKTILILAVAIGLLYLGFRLLHK